MAVIASRMLVLLNWTRRLSSRLMFWAMATSYLSLPYLNPISLMLRTSRAACCSMVSVSDQFTSMPFVWLRL